MNIIHILFKYKLTHTNTNSHKIKLHVQNIHFLNGKKVDLNLLPI